MERMIRLDERIVQVKVPLPFPLLWVNAYIVMGSGGATVIDPGLRTEASIQVWKETLAELGLAFSDIEAVVLTHHHPDHYGLAGWFQSHSGAPVRMSELGYRQAMWLWGDDREATEEVCALFADHGMPPHTVEQIRSHMEEFVAMVSPHPERVEMIEEGANVRLGDTVYRAIRTDGHALGHLCFYSEERQEMFCGDHVLPQITPNISLLPGQDANPLRSFLADLARISKISVRNAYPGHREPFRYFNKRTEDIIQHHEDRLARIASLLSDRPLSAYELCLALFGGKLSAHQLRFAMSETIAHAVELEARETVRFRSDQRPIVIEAVLE